MMYVALSSVLGVALVHRLVLLDADGHGDHVRGRGPGALRPHQHAAQVRQPVPRQPVPFVQVVHLVLVNQALPVELELGDAVHVRRRPAERAPDDAGQAPEGPPHGDDVLVGLPHPGHLELGPGEEEPGVEPYPEGGPLVVLPARRRPRVPPEERRELVHEGHVFRVDVVRQVALQDRGELLPQRVDGLTGVDVEEVLLQVAPEAARGRAVLRAPRLVHVHRVRVQGHVLPRQAPPPPRLGRGPLRIPRYRGRRDLPPRHRAPKARRFPHPARQHHLDHQGRRKETKPTDVVDVHVHV
mmetsp:Transcript_13530/g.38040  ORF Transcript_13530/g.38040 Transcript_13530/m.38040 type:complete len:298 (+) Transcript_13530:735-1628(+)